MSMKHDIVHQALSGITDRDTIKSYKSSIGEFCSWAKNEQGITKLKDLKGRRTEIINEYSRYLQDKGYSSGTIHTYLAPVCKGLQTKMSQIEKPKRKAGDVTKRRIDGANLRGRREAQQDRYKRSVMLSQATGARRSELAKITYKDLMKVDENGYRCVAIYGGKGGKNTYQRLTPEQIVVCDGFIKQASESGISLTERVLMPSEISDHISYHTNRAERAVTSYHNYIKRIETEGRETIKQELVDRWNALNPIKDQIFIRSDGSLTTQKKSRAKNFIKIINDAEKPYKLRGDNRRRALEEGRPVVYDRLALLAVSVFDLSHWRVDVTMTNYML